MRLSDVATGECIAILHHFPNGGWAILTSDNYFMADATGRRHLTFVDQDLALFPASKMPHLENERKVRQALARVFGPVAETP